MLSCRDKPFWMPINISRFMDFSVPKWLLNQGIFSHIAKMVKTAILAESLANQHVLAVSGRLRCFPGVLPLFPVYFWWFSGYFRFIQDWPDPRSQGPKSD